MCKANIDATLNFSQVYHCAWPETVLCTTTSSCRSVHPYVYGTPAVLSGEPADAIGRYADLLDIDVVQTYSDLGRSGLTVAGRAGLRALLEDVEKKRNDFSVLLVYDVSRWGRFQDADESAYYEFILKKAGVHVHYCAEQFVNDGSLASVLLKAIKRTMAGEFSRELGVKVFAGKSRLVERGFHQGGYAGYGLRRQLVDMDGSPKAVLGAGEWKSLHSDRVILVPGPEAEVAVVASIFKSFIELEKGESEIARDLNAQGWKTSTNGPWTRDHVHKILVSPKYIGCNVFNRHSCQTRQKKGQESSRDVGPLRQRIPAIGLKRRLPEGSGDHR